MFKLGFSTIACPDYTIDQVIALARDNGFPGIEIRHLRGTADLGTLAELSPAKIKETKRRFDDAGIEVIGIDTSVRMNSLDPAVRAKQIELAQTNLVIAESLGAKYLRVFGGPIPAGQDLEQTLDAIAAGLAQVASMTKERGISSLLETHDHFSTSPNILDLYRRGAGDNLGILWDTLHSYRHGETGEYTWSQLGDRVEHVHVKDSLHASASGFDFALTGEGAIPIKSFLRLLEKEGYEGYVSFEWEKGWHPEIAGPEVSVPHFAQFMAQAL